MATSVDTAATGSNRLSAFFYRHHWVKLGALLGSAAAVVPDLLHRGARRALRLGLLAPRRLHRQGREGVQPPELPDPVHGPRLPHHHAPDGGDRRGRHGDRHHPRVPARLLRRTGWPPPDRATRSCRGGPPVVGELRGAGLRVATDPVAGRLPGLARSSLVGLHVEVGELRSGGSGSRSSTSGCPFTMLPIYALARARAGLVPGGVERPRCQGMAHVPAGRLPHDRAGHRGGVDLLVLAHARRLHRAVVGREHEVHRQRDLRQRRRREQRARSRPRTRSCPWP